MKLKELLTPASRWEAPVVGTRYRQLGVRLWGAGAYEREPLDGAGTKYAQLNRVKANDVVVNKIWARNGSVAIVPPVLDGAVVSNEFPLFEPGPRLLPEWFELFTKTADCWDQCDKKARGTSGQNRIRPEKFLEVEIPLPSLDEQKRIVAKVQEAMGALDRAATLNAQTVADFDRLLISLAHREDLTDEQKRDRGWRKLRLGDVMHLDLDPVKVDPSQDYPNLGIYSFARGAFGKPALSGLSLRAATLFRVQAGQFVYLKLNGYEGAFARVPEELDGFYVTNEFPTFSALPGQARSEWIACHFMKPSVWASLAHKSKGTPTRRQRVNPPAILAHEAWVPPMPEQDHIAEVLTAQRRFAAGDTFQKDADALRRSILSKAFRGEL